MFVEVLQHKWRPFAKLVWHALREESRQVVGNSSYKRSQRNSYKVGNIEEAHGLRSAILFDNVGDHCKCGRPKCSSAEAIQNSKNGKPIALVRRHQHG